MMVLYGEGYGYYGLKAEEITEMGEEELGEIARVQRECLYRCHPLEREVTRREVQAVLEAER